MKDQLGFGTRRVGVLCALFVGSLTQLAQAEVRSERDGQHLRYEFEDADTLAADGSSPYDSFLKGRIPKPARVQLIRPRSSFVPELLKSVEHI